MRHRLAGRISAICALGVLLLPLRCSGNVRELEMPAILGLLESGRLFLLGRTGWVSHHFRYRHRHEVRSDRRHTGAGILQPRNNRDPGRPPDRSVQYIRQTLSMAFSICARLCSTTAVRHGSNSSLSCRKCCERPACSATACHSTSGKSGNEVIGSDSFLEFSRDFEPYDRLLFQKGRVDPFKTASFSFLVTDFTPRAQFYLVLDPRIPST